MNFWKKQVDYKKASATFEVRKESDFDMYMELDKITKEVIKPSPISP